MSRTPIHASLASIPSRVNALERTIRSLLSQVDRICVYLNGYDYLPGFLDHPQIEVAHSQDHGERGDAGKFFWADRVPTGYHLTCDDDLVYPHDYASRIVEAIERHHRRAVVGFHGYVLHPPVTDIQRRRTKYLCLRTVAGEHVVHVLGTGALGYHTGTITLLPSDFPRPNMADLWLAARAQTDRIPLICLPHEEGWLEHISHGSETIFGCSRARTGSPMDTRDAQTELARSINWRLHPPPRATIIVAILTDGQADQLQALLGDLERERSRFDCDLLIRIYDDASSDSREIERVATRQGYAYIRAATKQGKRAGWRRVAQELADPETTPAEWFVFLSDDCRLADHFFARALDLWASLAERAAPDLAALQGRQGPCWTSHTVSPPRNSYDAGWIDSPYICRRDLLDSLDYHVPPVSGPRGSKPQLGSCVGFQLSRRLVARRSHLYRADPSLGEIADIPGPTNSETRDLDPRRTLTLVDEVDDTELHLVHGPQRTAIIAARRGDHISRMLASNRYYESDLLDALRDLLAVDVYVDVGAHVGNHSAYFALECAAERVVAIEPDLESYIRLATTIERNALKGKVSCIRAAVHPTWANAAITPGPAGNTGMARTTETGHVPVIRLDDILWDERVGLIKIDVEGLAAEVLATASRVIARDKPIVAAEAQDEVEFSATSALLSPLGYRRRGPYGRTPVWIWEPK